MPRRGTSGSIKSNICALCFFILSSLNSISDVTAFLGGAGHHHVPAVARKTYNIDDNSAAGSNKKLRRRIDPSSSHSSPSALCVWSPRNNNLVSGLAEISFGFSLGVLWSEYSIIWTGCPPVDLSDFLERLCYQGVIISSGLALFNRIISRGRSLKEVSDDVWGPLDDSTLIQVEIAEYTSAIAALGSFTSLGVQIYIRQANMDGLSGIDVDLCRAINDL